jgi:hypothetical protein
VFETGELSQFGHGVKWMTNTIADWLSSISRLYARQSWSLLGFPFVLAAADYFVDLTTSSAYASGRDSHGQEPPGSLELRNSFSLLESLPSRSIAWTLLIAECCQISTLGHTADSLTFTSADLSQLA